MQLRVTLDIFVLLAAAYCHLIEATSITFCPILYLGFCLGHASLDE